MAEQFEFDELVEGHPSSRPRNDEEAEYALHLLSQDLTERTCYVYLRNYRLFPKEINQQSVNSFLAMHTSQPARAAIQQFLLMKGIKDITIYRKRGHKPVKAKSMISEPDFQLLRSAMYQRNKKWGLMFDTLASTGVRISELTSIRTVDLNLNNWKVGSPLRVKVLGKGRKERFVVIPPSVSNTLMQYLEELSQRKVVMTDEPIFQVAPNTFYNVLSRVEMKLFGKAIYSPHSFRHRAITSWIRQGLPVEQAQSRAGHSDLSTTGHYLHLNDSEIAESWEEEYKNDKSTG